MEFGLRFCPLGLPVCNGPSTACATAWWYKELTLFRKWSYDLSQDL